MEHSVAIGVWMVLIAAPCIVSWLIGDAVGAARTRSYYCIGTSPDAPSRAHRPLTAKRQRRKRAAPAVADDPLTLEHKRRRREAFATMPPLVDLRAQANAIRRSESAVIAQVCNDATSRGNLTLRSFPAADRTLRHYRASIHELHRANGDGSGTVGGLILWSAHEECELANRWDAKRIPDAEPLSVALRCARLAVERQERRAIGTAHHDPRL